MKQAIVLLMKRPSAKNAILTALMFQLIFCIIWMTGYSGVTDNVKHLKIALVNEDASLGSAIAGKLKEQLPFAVETAESRQAAMDKLENREVHMVVALPADFSKQVQTPGQQAKIQYYVNESNPQMIKSVMQGVAAAVTAQGNKEAVAAGIQAVLGQAQVPAQQARGTAQGLSEKVVSDIQSLHPVKGMNNQMVPMMMVLASFVGAMIMQMNLQQAAGEVGAAVGRWPMFGARTVVNLASALVVSGIGSALVLAFGGQHDGGYLSIWLFQSLFMAAFMFYSQMFLLLFGAPGMLFNIVSLSLQLVSSGAMVPRELLNGFYQGLSDYLPATHAVNGMMNLLFGGPTVGFSAGMLVLVLVVCFGAGAVAVLLRKPKEVSDRNRRVASNPV